MNKFIVLTRSRTGSNFLVSLLNSHPEIEAKGELLRRQHEMSFKQLIDKGLSSKDEHVNTAGFKMFYYHPIGIDRSETWKMLTDITELKIIHLKRKNILRTLVSRKFAEQNDIWHQTATKKDPKKKKKCVSFEVEELEMGFSRTRRMETQGDVKFKNHRVWEVYYEDLVKDPEKICEQAFEFLEVSSTWSPSSPLIRQNPESLSDLICNFDELKEKFSGTKWSVFFD